MSDFANINSSKISQCRSVRVLFKRDLTDRLISPVTYIGMTAACLLSTFLLANSLETLENLSVIVSVDPSRATLFVVVMFMALYLGVTTSMAIAQEREHRTLEVLFCAPITHTAFVLSKFLRDVSVFCIILVILYLFLVIESRITNLAIGPKSLRSMALSFFLIWPMLSFSLLISSLVKTVRKAIILFTTAIFILGGIQLIHSFLYNLSSGEISVFLLYIRQALAVVVSILRWVSPISYIAAATGAIPASVSIALFWYAVSGVIYSFALLWLTIAVLRKKGIYGL